MLAACVRVRVPLLSALDTADEKPRGTNIRITDQDWQNADNMLPVLKPFAEAGKELEGYYITPICPQRHDNV